LIDMMNQFEDIQKFGKENMDATVKALGSVSMGAQAIAVETADYAKKSFEQSSAVLEKLVGAKSLDKAIEIQTDYVKSAYEGFVAQSTKIGELYTNLAKEMVKPMEAAVAKTTAAAKTAAK
jgi:hypothetical protein